MVELACSKIMNIGIDQNRRLWFVLDELAALGNLPALSPLMTEGRKYGACIMACLQNLSQLNEPRLSNTDKRQLVSYLYLHYTI